MTILFMNKLLTKVTPLPATKSEALQQVTNVNLAAIVKQCFTSSAAAHRPNWMVACFGFTGLTMLLFSG